MEPEGRLMREEDSYEKSKGLEVRLVKVEREVRQLKGALAALKRYTDHLGLMTDPDRIGEERDVKKA